MIVSAAEINLRSTISQEKAEFRVDVRVSKGCPDRHSKTAGREGGSAARLKNFLSTHLQDGIFQLERGQLHASMQYHGMGHDNTAC